MNGIALGVVTLLLAAPHGETHGAANQPMSAHVMLAGADLRWGDAPAALPKGAHLVVLSGDPGKSGPFALRLQMPAGYKIAPHWHPTDEHVTVLSGTFAMGMGETFDPKATKALAPGGYALMPAEQRHYAWTPRGAVVQVHGMGPFVLNYVHAADDPRSPPPGP
jgi:quercetin dioxygenase-like cupin family protein